MANITYQGVGIKAISACVPPKIMQNKDLSHLIPEEEIQKVIHSIGINEKRYAEADVCSSDLCFKAAQKLMEDNQIDPKSIDGLIFVSQTADYKVPPTSTILQHRLELNQECFAFDVNMACSGYVYGLSIAYAFANQIGVNRVLLLVGETLSKIISQKDKVTVPLFGDAGTATLIEKGEYPDAFFSLNSDGSGAEIMQIPYGGARKPSCIEGFKEIIDEEGNSSTGEQIQMIGMDVFNFGIRVVPSDIKNLVAFSGRNIEDIGVMVFHQANRFMTNFFAKRLKLPAEKTPYCMDRFGNTSSASVPLTIVSELYDPEKFTHRDCVVMSGFGAGLSWGTAMVSLSDTKISELIDY
jgi:3-oxoacyl-[acyl-carrier-protein] synthase III